MSLRQITPCDYSGVCPYNAEAYGSCEYWCGADEPQDDPEDWEEYSGYSYPQDNPPIPEGIPAVWEEDNDPPEDYEPDVDECGYNPYLGCYDFDC